MSTETNQEATVTPEATEEKEPVVDTSADIAKLNETIGSLKRELKDAKKAAKPPVETETPEKTEPTDNGLIEKTFLRAAQITAEDEVELALETAKKWDMPIDKLVDDEDFVAKLSKHRTAKANADATSNVKGDKSGTSQKYTPEYWLAKGELPTREQVPDRKARIAITNAFKKDSENKGKFYNG